MKGKYANAAEKRREMEALEARVSAAERRQECAETQLAEDRARAAREIATLKDRLKAVTAERDAGNAPALIAAEDRYRIQQAELRDLQEDYGKLQKINYKLMDGTHRWLMEATGCTGAEALERIGHLTGLPGIQADPADGISQQFLSEAQGSPERLAQVRQLQVLHGRRRVRSTSEAGDPQ